MTVDTTGGVGEGNVYAIWNTQFTCCSPGTDFTRSTDGGFTYQGPFVLPAHPKWGTLDVGPDGELFIVGTRIDPGAFPELHMVLRSTNAQDPAQTPIFDLVTGVDLDGTTNFGNDPNPGGLIGQIWIAADRSEGPTRGNVYVLASVDPPGPDPLDVHFVRSVDNGLTWSSPVRVNDDEADNGAWQWFATMSVGPNGRIDVIWNDTRNSDASNISELFTSYSDDAGLTWAANDTDRRIAAGRETPDARERWAM